MAEANKKHFKKLPAYNEGAHEVMMVKKIPVDIRHNYKTDYEKVIKLISTIE